MFFSEEKNQKTLSYSNLEVSAHDVVEDSVVKWAGLILSEVGAFKLGNASLKGSIGIRLCWDSNLWETPFAMKRLAQLDNFIFAKMRLLESALIELCACLWGIRGK